jgi:hypothetical protein
MLFDVVPSLPDFHADRDYDALDYFWPLSPDGSHSIVNFLNYVWSDPEPWLEAAVDNFLKGANVVILAPASTFWG